VDWIATIIVGILSLLGVVITNSASNQKMNAALEKAQAVTDTKIVELTREVRDHNSFAQKIPVIESEIKHINDKLNELEREINK